MKTFRIANYAALILLLSGAAIACSNGQSSPVHKSPSSITAQQQPSSVSLSPAQFCAALTPEDVAPLTDGEVTDKPTPIDRQGLPGCKWPTENGWGWLEMEAFKPVNAEALLSTAKEGSTRVGDGTMHYWIALPGSCKSFVTSPKTPAELLLAVDYSTPGGVSKKGVCESLVPQVEKVMKALDW